jgi:hypothetical protein
VRGQGHTYQSKSNPNFSNLAKFGLKAAHAFAAGAAKGQVLEPVPVVPLRVILARAPRGSPVLGRVQSDNNSLQQYIEPAVIDNRSARQNAPRRAITSFSVIKMIFRSSPTLRVRI